MGITLSNALHAERLLEYEGIPVLYVSVTLPQCSGTDRAARRFNRYYTQYAEAYLQYCTAVLLPDASEEAALCLSDSRPWMIRRAELDYRVSLHSELLLSIVTEQQSGGRQLLRRSDVWDTVEVLPVALSELFPKGHWRKRLSEAARQQVLSMLRSRKLQCHPLWRFCLCRTLSGDRWYLTDEGLFWYYPAHTLTASDEGIPTFFLPYDAERGPYPLVGEPVQENAGAVLPHSSGEEAQRFFSSTIFSSSATVPSMPSSEESTQRS